MSFLEKCLQCLLHRKMLDVWSMILDVQFPIKRRIIDEVDFPDAVQPIHLLTDGGRSLSLHHHLRRACQRWSWQG